MFRRIDRRALLRGGAALFGASLLGRLRQAGGPALVQAHPRQGRGRQPLRPAAPALAREARARICRERHLALVQAERHIGPAGPNLQGARRQAVLHLPARDRRPREPAVELLAGGPAPDAVAHPDHAPRLRRGLELHRQVDRRAAERAAEQGRAQAPGPLHRVPLRRHDGERPGGRRQHRRGRTSDADASDQPGDAGGGTAKGQSRRRSRIPKRRRRRQARRPARTATGRSAITRASTSRMRSIPRPFWPTT